MNKTINHQEEEEEDQNEHFYESLDRLHSNTTSCASSSSSSIESDRDENSYDSPLRPLPIPKFPIGVSGNYDVWISEPSSVEERRLRLLQQMGLSRQKSDRVNDSDESVNKFNSNSSDDNEINSISNDLDNGVVKLKSDSGSPNKPPTGKICRRVNSNNSTVSIRELDYSPRWDENVGETDPLCTIKNLDNGKEFVVNEVRDDGMWNKVKEVSTGRQLTMEEFDSYVGQSPIVQELMRRQNVEEGNNLVSDTTANNVKLKKKGSWFKSIKSVASSVKGHKERKSSDERDTSSEKGGRRSSSATDDSQDASFHCPERVRVRQYGKSCKELTALYKSQVIQAHCGSIWAIKFSLDGKYLASAGEDGMIHVRQVVESERKDDMLFDRQEEGNLNLLFAVNGSPEPMINLDGQPEKKRRGRTRSSFSRKSVSLDHIAVPDTVFALTENPICTFQGHLDDVLDLSWSKSQHLLSSSMDKTVRLWHLSSNACLKVFSHSDYVTCIQFNPVDDDHFISGSLDGKVRLWSIPDHQVIDWNDLHEMVTAACYTPDGQAALVGSYKGSCRMYNTSENKMQHKSHINLHNKKKKSRNKKITGFQFAPGSISEVLITSTDSRVRVVDGGDLVHKFKGFRNSSSQISASLTANGKYVVSASEDSQVYIWKNDGDSRPSRTKGLTVTQSYEHFHCQDVSAAIPWPGMSAVHHFDMSAGNYPTTPVNYLFDRLMSSDEFSSGIKWAWGMVIVTAGLKGEIQTFQNFGLPVRT
jgi:WD40 repeat protein